MTDRVKMTVVMDVTVPQGLALQAMFNYWNLLSGWGGSRFAGFYADGDGNFHPKCKVRFNKIMPELTDELSQAAVVKDDDGNKMFDFNPIAWKLRS